MNKTLRESIKVVLIFCTPLVALFLLTHINVVVLGAIEDHHFELITINSIFAGFLFSGLSMILGLGGNNTVTTLERIGSMDKIYFSITSGLICAVFSIFCSLVSIFVKRTIFITNLIAIETEQIVCFLEVYFLMQTIIMFALSAKYVFLIIKYSRLEIVNRRKKRD